MSCLCQNYPNLTCNLARHYLPFLLFPNQPGNVLKFKNVVTEEHIGFCKHKICYVTLCFLILRKQIKNTHLQFHWIQPKVLTNKVKGKYEMLIRVCISPNCVCQYHFVGKILDYFLWMLIIFFERWDSLLQLMFLVLQSEDSVSSFFNDTLVIVSPVFW